MKIYLAHSVFERNRGKRIQKKLEDLGFEVINPFDQEDPSVLKDPWNINDTLKAMEIVITDMLLIQDADLLVGIFGKRKTIGVSCEVLLAWILSKPIYLLVSKELKGHPWLKTLSNDRIFTDEKDLLFLLSLEKLVEGK